MVTWARRYAQEKGWYKSKRPPRINDASWPLRAASLELPCDLWAAQLINLFSTALLIDWVDLVGVLLILGALFSSWVIRSPQFCSFRERMFQFWWNCYTTEWDLIAKQKQSKQINKTLGLEGIQAGSVGKKGFVLITIHKIEHFDHLGQQLYRHT